MCETLCVYFWCVCYSHIGFGSVVKLIRAQSELKAEQLLQGDDVD